MSPQLIWPLRNTSTLRTWPIRSAVTNSTLSSLTRCVAQCDRTYVCVFRDPLITVRTKSKSVKHKIHLVEKSQGSAFTLLMYRYLCLSFCCKNKARICANNRNGWLSEGEPQCSISCRHSVVCSHFPLVSLWSTLFLWLLLSPLCQSSDWKLGLSMSTSTLVFSCFAPKVTPGGPPWSVS